MGAPQEGGANPYSNFIFLGAIFVIMYLFMIRPQMKKAKEQKNFLSALLKGNKIVTNGGIHGVIAKVNEHTVVVEVDNNTRLTIEKSSIIPQVEQKKQQPNKDK